MSPRALSLSRRAVQVEARASRVVVEPGAYLAAALAALLVAGYAASALRRRAHLDALARALADAGVDARRAGAAVAGRIGGRAFRVRFVRGPRSEDKWFTEVRVEAERDWGRGVLLAPDALRARLPANLQGALGDGSALPEDARRALLALPLATVRADGRALVLALPGRVADASAVRAAVEAVARAG